MIFPFGVANANVDLGRYLWYMKWYLCIWRLRNGSDHLNAFNALLNWLKAIIDEVKDNEQCIASLCCILNSCGNPIVAINGDTNV